MNMTLKLLAGAAIALAITTMPALADGMAKKSYAEPKEGCDNRFGGAYIGGSVGLATAKSTVTDRNGFHLNDEGGVQNFIHDQAGLTIAGSAGYNIQKCAAVFGIVGDIAYSDVSSGRSYINTSQAAGNAGQDRIGTSLDWLFSVRGKAGLAMDNLFLYTTGGLALAQTGLSVHSDNTFVAGLTRPVDARSSDWTLGWVVGAGTEYAINDKISITSEALYYNFATAVHGISPINSNGALQIDDQRSMWVARVGVNFKLGGSSN